MPVQRKNNDVSPCSKCSKRTKRLHPALVQELEPWLLDWGVHGWCLRCINKLTEVHLRAIYERWLKIQRANPGTDALSAHEKRKAAMRMGDSKITLIGVATRDGWICALCHEKVSPSVENHRDRWAPSIDHVLPISRGGQHVWVNVQLAHRSCNSRKKARLSRELKEAKVNMVGPSASSGGWWVSLDINRDEGNLDV